MKTPIYDFVKEYALKRTARLHMPGHKGNGALGVEKYDITEIQGADTLYGAEGIIQESERNTSALFGSAHTFYSAEGSTLAIKAMLALATVGRSKKVLAARNAHKAFVYAAALLDLEVAWLYGKDDGHLCACHLTAEDVRKALGQMAELPSAVYLTSPDYLGNIADVKGISKVCRELGVTLLVDNAHGAYLKFLSPSLHPLDMGADMCCDSAHKTLPVLTGGAYLHVSKNAPNEFCRNARSVLSIFASTSPSYLILASLDKACEYIDNGFEKKLALFSERLEQMTERIKRTGFEASRPEPLKIVIEPLSMGYTGTELAGLLRDRNVEAEFADATCAVLMATPENSEEELLRLENALGDIPKKAPMSIDIPPIPRHAKRAATIREAVFSPHEKIKVGDSEGRVCAAPTVSCPPAVPIAVSGEIISAEHIRAFEFYGISEIDVIKS